MPVAGRLAGQILKASYSKSDDGTVAVRGAILRGDTFESIGQAAVD